MSLSLSMQALAPTPTAILPPPTTGARQDHSAPPTTRDALTFRWTVSANRQRSHWEAAIPCAPGPQSTNHRRSRGPSIRSQRFYCWNLRAPKVVYLQLGEVFFSSRLVGAATFTLSSLSITPWGMEIGSLLTGCLDMPRKKAPAPLPPRSQERG